MSCFTPYSCFTPLLLLLPPPPPLLLLLPPPQLLLLPLPLVLLLPPPLLLLLLLLLLLFLVYDGKYAHVSNQIVSNHLYLIIPCRHFCSQDTVTASGEGLDVSEERAPRIDMFLGLESGSP